MSGENKQHELQASASKPLLYLDDVSREFKSEGKTAPVRVINNVTLKIFRGEGLALVGESGSGKSTLAKLIMGLHQPSSGTIYFDGQPLSEFSKRKEALAYRRQVQMLFQDPFSSLNPARTIFYHLARAVKLHQGVRKKQEVLAAVEQALERVELSPAKDFLQRYPYQLSGGQRQRVNIARLLAVGARLILADEPTSMLDVSIRTGIINLLAQLKRDEGISLLYITHDIASARYIAEKMAVIYCGHIVEWGDTEQIIQHPRHPYTQLLIAATPDASQHITTPLPGKRNTEAPLWRADSEGCPFAHRCIKASDECLTSFRAEKDVGNNQVVRCNLY